MQNNVFYYFFSEGNDYFNRQEMVVKNKQVYEERLNEFKISFKAFN